MTSGQGHGRIQYLNWQEAGNIDTLAIVSALREKADVQEKKSRDEKVPLADRLIASGKTTAYLDAAIIVLNSQDERVLR